MAKIAICPGHHLRAPGAVNERYSLNEHMEARKVIQHLVTLLSEHEVRIFIGRLTEKVQMINQWNPTLAIDLHFNADADHLDPHDLNDSRGTGCMVMYCPRASSYEDKEPQSERRKQASTMSKIIAKELHVRNHGARPGWYWGRLDENGNPTHKDYFLVHTNCPAFIPEPLYIDNNADAKKWLVSNKHDKIAEALYKGIVEVLNMI